MSVVSVAFCSLYPRSGKSVYAFWKNFIVARRNAYWVAGGRSSAGGDPKTSTFRHGVENLACTLKRRAGYRELCGLSWNGSGGTWWADRGIFISHEAVGEIIANSDLQDFGLEAVVNWFIFCYFSTGRKYPAVVYGSYLTFPI